MFKNFFKWDKKSDRLESISFLILIVASVFTVIGISVGIFVPGIPVALAIMGAFLVLVSIVVYIVSELVRYFEKK